ncbi:MAG: hypothetical protein HYV24_06650 [Deltaproteobacteria bacterium]|nr:hypothetical protein [Deltaproteobacteria bacterium]
MNNSYFSDREIGPKPRIKEVVNIEAWGGIVSIIGSLIDNGSFGIEFPAVCPDGLGIIGTDFQKLSLAVRAEIPDLPWPIPPISTSTWPSTEPAVPSTLSILDLIEFCHRNIAQPVKGSHHSFFGHYHLDFNYDEGRTDFRQKINRILARNGLVYELQKDGQIIRLAPPILREVLQSTTFNTGDSELDVMLEAARKKFLAPSLEVRRESLEKLWDAWERLKTIVPGKDKKASIKTLLEKAAPEIKFRQILESEAHDLTEIGNNFQIRHSETTKIPIKINEHIDYLFHRLFAMIQLLLKNKLGL